MSDERAGIVVHVISEDKRTESFLRRLLVVSGFVRHKLRFHTAPDRGAADRWVIGRYTDLVTQHRRKAAYLRTALVASIDGDAFGLEQRQRQLDAELERTGSDARRADEAIAVLVPTRNIESWLLDLLGQPVDEDDTRSKERFRGLTAHTKEGALLRRAAQGWSSTPGLPSMVAGRGELARLGG